MVRWYKFRQGGNLIASKKKDFIDLTAKQIVYFKDLVVNASDRDHPHKRIGHKYIRQGAKRFNIHRNIAYNEPIRTKAPPYPPVEKTGQQNVQRAIQNLNPGSQHR